VSALATVLAAAPALPLDEAGKYVAGAFVAFVGVIMIYVGIMAVRLQRMSRELAELNQALDARARAEATRATEAERSSAVYARRDAESLHQDAGLDAPRR
jgi:hypothetical protein